jgi:ferric-dicitrate binding protein FerR (iron transport regulator)
MDKEVKAEVLMNIHKKTVIRHKRISFFRIAGIASVFLLAVLIPSGSYLYFSKKYRIVPEEFVVMTENGYKTKIRLPDGTHVWLNSGSRLICSSDYNQNNRVVRLEGEAFFQVKKNTGIEFTVETERINIVARGTAFNVSAYSEDATIDVSLLQGKVILEGIPDDIFLTELAPDQQASVSKKDLTCTVQACDAAMESLWIRNKLKFENTPATEVFRKLERWYGVKIYAANRKNDIFYGFTVKSESLREILDEINKITPIVYKVNGEEVHITYK